MTGHSHEPAVQQRLQERRAPPRAAPSEPIQSNDQKPGVDRVPGQER